ncbi:MAG TPA: hypothetical protein VF138_10560 [Caulobacteraceae bacterium]
MPQLTTRDAVTRAMAAMEIAESCSHPEIRSSFTSLAEDWLEQAAELAGEAREDASQDEGLTL